MGSIPAEGYVACAKALSVDVIRRILFFVGEGHYVFLAGVCTEWKDHYQTNRSNGTTHSSVVESVERLRWAKECGYEPSVETFEAAAESGEELSVVEELHRLDCPWARTVCAAAARNTRHGLRILKWLRSEDLPDKKKCPWSKFGMSPWSKYGMGIEAVRYGHKEILEWLLSDAQGYPLDGSLWLQAVRAGRIHVLEMLAQHPRVKAEMEAAPEGSQWRAGPECAAQEGNLEVLQWLRTSAVGLCSWNKRVCSCAVKHGKSLFVLKWLRSEEVMCPWNSLACPQYVKTFYGDHWQMDPAAVEEMKQWVHANGHPCNCP